MRIVETSYSVGDALMAAGRAKQLHHLTGNKISIGDGERVFWHPLYNNNPYLSKQSDTWVIDYPSHRGYVTDVQGHRVVFNMDYRAVPADIFFTGDELRQVIDKPYLIVEPNVKNGAPKAKRWPYMQDVVDSLKIECVQFDYGQPLLKGVTPIKTTIRQAAIHMSGAVGYVGPEGGLHHLAAALGKPAVVIFGAYTPPQITGYSFHTNIYRHNADELGNRKIESKEMTRITPDTVIAAIQKELL